MARLGTHVRLAHPGPALTVLVVGVGSGLLASPDGLSRRKAALLVATLASNQYATGALNDVLDAPRDAQSQRDDKPIVSGAISTRAAGWWGVGAAVASVITASRLNRTVLGLDLAWLCCAGAYNGWLKPTPWSVVPFVLALPLVPLFGVATGGHVAAHWWWVWPIGVTGALAVHLADALPDLEFDAASHAQGLAVRLGLAPASKLEAASYALMTFLATGSVASRSRLNSAILGAWGLACGSCARGQARRGRTGKRRSYALVLAGVGGQALIWVAAMRRSCLTV